MTWRKREIADEAHSNRTTMNIYTSQSEYLKVEVQRLSALVRAQQITIDKLEAQRTWVGLTDDEIQTTWNSVMDGAVFTRREVYKAIEAKLKEKNT